MVVGYVLLIAAGDAAYRLPRAINIKLICDISTQESQCQQNL